MDARLDEATEKIIALPIAQVVDGNALRFERHFDAPIARVWELVTSPEGWQWCASMQADLRSGGAFTLEFDEQQSMRGHVLQLEPPRRLVLNWVEFEVVDPASPPRQHKDSELTIELQPDGDGTRFTLTHRYITRDDAASFGAGWHAIIGKLQGYAATGTWGASEGGFERLLPRYRALVEATFRP
jgi:uncharacterized protein YndB with AHSA1/START domain